MVELTTDLISRISVKALGITEEAEAGLEVSSAFGEVVGGALDLILDLFAFAPDISDALADLGLWKLSVRCQVEQVVLLGFERLQLVFELLLEESLGCRAVGQRLVDSLFHPVDEVFAEADCPVVLCHGILDALEAGVASVAGLVLDAAAEEVEVFATAAADGMLNDHALDDSVLSPAAAAEQAPFEVLMVNAPALTGDPAGIEQVIDPAEELLGNQGVVASGIVLALEDVLQARVRLEEIAVMTRAYGYSPLPKNMMSKLFDLSARNLSQNTDFKYIITALNPFLGFKGSIFLGASFNPFALSPLDYRYTDGGLYANRRRPGIVTHQKYPTPPIVWLVRSFEGAPDGPWNGKIVSISKEMYSNG